MPTRTARIDQPGQPTACLHDRDVVRVLPPPVQLAVEHETVARVDRFVGRIYPEHYPDLALPPRDRWDSRSYVLYSEGADGELTGCMKVTRDGAGGLPEEKTYAAVAEAYRARGLTLMEPRRFAVHPDHRGLGLVLLLGVYQLACRTGTDVLIFVLRTKDLPFYRRLVNVREHEPEVAGGYGSAYPLRTVAWHIADTPTRFFQRALAAQAPFRT